MKFGAFILVFAVLLVFGCVKGIEEEDEFVMDPPGQSVTPLPDGKTETCENVTRETPRCWDAPFNFSMSNLIATDPYALETFCVGGASIDVTNLESIPGEFTINFVFKLPVEGKIVKSSTKVIAGKSLGKFETKAQFRCSQDFTMEVEVSPPRKQVCGKVNVTIEECVVK